jgi:hypothetical protein
MDRDLEHEPSDLDARSAEETQEIAALVSLLRSLPEPEPEADLTARVMAAVRQIEERPRIVRLFESIRRNEASALIAAGIACLAVGIGLGGIRAPSEAERRIVATPEPTVTAALPAQPPARRSGAAGPVGYAGVMPVGYGVPLFGGPVPAPMLPSVSRPNLNPMDRHLDTELNALQLDPDAYLLRLERVRERERFVQRLAERAARRGDAAQVALRVRVVPHEYTSSMVEQFLHASLVHYMAERGPAER